MGLAVPVEEQCQQGAQLHPVAIRRLDTFTVGPQQRTLLAMMRLHLYSMALSLRPFHAPHTSRVSTSAALRGGHPPRGSRGSRLGGELRLPCLEIFLNGYVEFEQRARSASLLLDKQGDLLPFSP